MHRFNVAQSKNNLKNLEVLRELLIFAATFV